MSQPCEHRFPADDDGRCFNCGEVVADCAPPPAPQPCDCACHKVGLFGLMCCPCTKRVLDEFVNGKPQSPQAPQPEPRPTPEAPQTPVDDSTSGDCNTNCRKHATCRERANRDALSALLQAAKDYIEFTSASNGLALRRAVEKEEKGRGR